MFSTYMTRDDAPKFIKINHNQSKKAFLEIMDQTQTTTNQYIFYCVYEKDVHYSVTLVGDVKHGWRSMTPLILPCNDAQLSDEYSHTKL